MNTALFAVLVLLLLTLIGYGVQRTRVVAAKISAEPDPTRIAILQMEALVIALATVETLPESAEIKAKRRQVLLEKQKNVQRLLEQPAEVQMLQAA